MIGDHVIPLRLPPTMSTPAPNREERARCWQSRDAYFRCLDRAQVIVPGREGKACDAENKPYEKNCAASWVCLASRLDWARLKAVQVAYFNKQRVLAERQRATLEAAEKQRLESRG